MNFKELTPQSMCIHAGASVNDSRAVVQPIYQTSAFRFDSTGHGAALFAGRQEGYISMHFWCTGVSKPWESGWKSMRKTAWQLPGSWKLIPKFPGFAIRV
jgi:cystathionine beta-lyase/cystathionine gamma-synthase